VSTGEALVLSIKSRIRACAVLAGPFLLYVQLKDSMQLRLRTYFHYLSSSLLIALGLKETWDAMVDGWTKHFLMLKLKQ
jgi:hypothetical protein